jgi:thiol-disulfide isomerase/thioredoxin
MIARFLIALLLITSISAAAQTRDDISVYKAREIRQNGPWINSGPVQLKSLRGKIVVLDFWAFDCEPCIEAMPHIVDVYNKYARQGVVVIGIHTPRADYEKDVSKLKDVMKKLGIQFPVVVDKDQKIFRDYLCDLWPSQFVIDQNGMVRFSHGGVGRYDDLVEVVESLLKTTP